MEKRPSVALHDALDHLTSRETAHIKKGLAALEQHLASIALQPAGDNGYPSDEDPAYCAFLASQDTFDGNIAGQLCHLLRRLTDDGDAEVEATASQALMLLQGCVLLHRPSQRLFARQCNLQLLLDLIARETASSTLCIAALTTLVCCLVDRPASLRVFEACRGLELLCDTFKAAKTPHPVKIKMLEFFYFYLMPEKQESAREAQDGQAETVRSPSKTVGRRIIPRDLVGVVIDDEEGTVRAAPLNRSGPLLRSREEKKRLLGLHLTNVDALVASFDALAPF
jgi:hypothetical protein